MSKKDTRPETNLLTFLVDMFKPNAAHLYIIIYPTSNKFTPKIRAEINKTWPFPGSMAFGRCEFSEGEKEDCQGCRRHLVSTADPPEQRATWGLHADPVQKPTWPPIMVVIVFDITNILLTIVIVTDLNQGSCAVMGSCEAEVAALQAKEEAHQMIHRDDVKWFH